MDLHNVLPEYPRTRHLPHKANAKRDDLIASYDECKLIFTQPTAIEEKVDGASCGMTIWEGHPLIRNRNHILNKAYSKKKNASKEQFSSIWTWWYDHRSNFKVLSEMGPYSVYGEWMWMAHGMIYNALPSLFLTYDLYDYERGIFVEPGEALATLAVCGFETVPLLSYDPVESFEQLETLANCPSAFTTQQREGIYLKVVHGNQVTHRFKMVREDFEQGKFLDSEKLMRNKLLKR
jgi:hypothetical protein